MTGAARILLVEDDPQDVELTVRAFRSEPVDIGEFRKAIRAVARYWLGVNRSPFGSFPSRTTDSSACALFSESRTTDPSACALKPMKLP